MNNDFKRSENDIHQLWNQKFTETPVKNTNLIIGNRINQTATKELVHRRLLDVSTVLGNTTISISKECHSSFLY